MSALIDAYGRYDPVERCWRASADDRPNGLVHGCIAIRQSTDIETPEGKRTYMLLEGPGEHVCHMCSGVMAFAVFDQRPGWRLIAHSPALAAGSQGAPTDPKSMPLRKLGPAQWGWVEQSSYLGQGDFDTSITIWLPHAATVQKAGVLPGSHELDCDSPSRTAACYGMKLTYQVDSRQTRDGYYPIVLTATGTKGGRRVNVRTASSFDLTTFAYQPVSPPLP